MPSSRPPNESERRERWPANARRARAHVPFREHGRLRHRRVFAYWRSKAPEGRPDIDPLEVPELLPWLTLIDAVWEGKRLRLRCRLILPLAADGDTVDMFLICFAFDVRGSDWFGIAGPDNAI